MCYDQSKVKKMDIKERNLEIINLRKNGLSVNEIAKTYDLSRGRIDKIILQHEEEKEIDKNIKELIKQIKQSDNMDKKWPMVDLVQSLRLSTKARIRMIKYFSGENYFDFKRECIINSESLVISEDGEELSITAGNEGVRFLLISGKPLREPIAWYGPIVMNTQEELRIAFDEFQKGTFLKHKI